MNVPMIINSYEIYQITADHIAFLILNDRTIYKNNEFCCAIDKFQKLDKNGVEIPRIFYEFYLTYLTNTIYMTQLNA